MTRNGRLATAAVDLSSTGPGESSCSFGPSDDSPSAPRKPFRKSEDDLSETRSGRFGHPRPGLTLDEVIGADTERFDHALPTAADCQQ